MGIGALTLSTAGAVTAPTTEPFDLPSADSTRANGYALASMVQVQFGKQAEPGLAAQGVMWANGIDPLRHYVAGVLGTGLLAPSTAPTVTSGTKASTRLNTDEAGAYVIADGDTIKLISTSAIFTRYYWVVFKTTLTLGANPEVLINGSTANALINLKKFLNQSGVEGTDYHSGIQALSVSMEAGTLTSTDLTITAKSYGTGPNSWACSWVGGAGPVFEEEGTTTNQSVFSGGTDASGTAPEAGKHTYGRIYVREDDGALSGLSPTASLTTASSTNVAITAMTASADSSVDYNRWYRTTVGGGRLYRGNEVSAATTTDTDSFADASLTGNGAVAYDERRFRSYRAGMPPKGRYLATYRGRVFTGGALLSAPYAAGTASVNSGATAVTVVGGYPRLSWVGRTVQFTTSETYLVMSVSESAGTFEIDRALEGGSNLSSVAYTVKDLRDPYEVFWSETGLPNQWPVTNSLKGARSEDGRGITGLVEAFESLIIFTRQSVWRLSGNDNSSFAIQKVTDRCGCISGHTVVSDGRRLYWLGPDGVYGWSGDGEPINLSSPQAEAGVVRGIDGTLARLSLQHAHRAVARLDEDDSEIHWFLPLDGERENNYALVLDLQTGAFSLDTAHAVTFTTRGQGATGDDVRWTGDVLGCIWQAEVSTSDGAYGFEQVQTVSSSTTRTVTVAGTPFPTSGNGMFGYPVWFVGATGDLTRNVVVSNTTATPTFARYMTAPTAATQFVVGGIPLWVQTGRADLGDRRRKKIVGDVVVAYSPQDDGDFYFFFASDQGDFAIPTRGWTKGDLSSTKGYRRFKVAKEAMLHGWGLFAIEPGCEPAFSGVTPEVGGWEEMDL